MRAASLMSAAALAVSAPAVAKTSHPAVVIDLDPPTNAPAFDPALAIGGGIDGAQHGDIDRLFTERNIAAMKSAGLRALTYRLRTELGIEAWHWNPVGQWSDPAHSEGYWTSSDVPGAPIQLSWGYRLPRRGDTLDQANNADYSRLTDGDTQSFWKSNPYLDPAVLHDGQAHPQWLMLHFGHPVQIDRAVIEWGAPYAVRYAVQYWAGDGDYDPDGRWVTFPHGTVERGGGGTASLVLADQPITTRHLRVLLLEGSGTAPPGASDWRDRLGFAVREISAGVAGPDGRMADVVVHAASHGGQTVAHVSSTDPWHRASDRDPDLEQVGLDRIFASGLGFGGPVMIPTGIMYDTPDNEAAELRYLARRGYPVRQVELGEEPDGQYGNPADYAALYVAATERLRGILSGARLGGPSLQSAVTETELLPEARGLWAKHFLDYLAARGKLDELGFFSFEFYPFDDICTDIPGKLVKAGGLLHAYTERLVASGLPRSVPRVISEYGFSAFSGRAESDLPSGLLMASIVGQWLSEGGSAAYMFGYGPNVPATGSNPCAGYGNMMLFLANPQGQATVPMPQLHVARMLTRGWTVPGGVHRVLPTRVADRTDAVSAWALERPDHHAALLVVNRNTGRRIKLDLIARRGGHRVRLGGPVTVLRFGADQYRWRDAGEESYPVLSEPAARAVYPAAPRVLEVPAQSVVVAEFSPPRSAR